MYTKISLSGFERFFTAICIAISAINLFISFIVAGYWYGESTVIPYTVLVACNFILLEVVLYSIITGMSGIGSLLDKKSKMNRKVIQENSVAPVTITPKAIEPATAILAPIIFNTIRIGYKILQRYDLTGKDFAKYKISYPPTEEMKDIKMYPPYKKEE